MIASFHKTDLFNRIPKLSSATTLEPYVRQGDEFATIDSAQLIDPKQKELANSLHLTQQAKKISKVCLPYLRFLRTCPTPPICYEENYPNAQALDAA